MALPSPGGAALSLRRGCCGVLAALAVLEQLTSYPDPGRKALSKAGIKPCKYCMHTLANLIHRTGVPSYHLDQSVIACESVLRL